MNFNIKFLPLSVVISAALLTWSCGSNRGESTTEEHSHEHHHEEGESLELSEKQIETVGIELHTMMKREIGASIRANGVLAVNPQDMAEISPLMAGVVTNILVTEGSKIGAGTTVATIENLEITGLQEDYRLAVEELSLARSAKERQELLASHGAGIRKNLEQATADYRTAQMKATAMETRLRQAGINPRDVIEGNLSKVASIKSPIGGIVNRISCTTGGFADMSTPIMTVTDNSKIYARLRIYEKDLPKVTPGQNVLLNLTNSGATLQGVVEQINPTIDPTSKGIDVKVGIIGSDRENLMPGMAVNASISSGEIESDVLPEEAVVVINGRNYIFVLEDIEEEDGETMYHFEPVEVVTGNRSQGLIEVKPLEELRADAKIVVSKAFYLASMSADHGEHNH